MNANMHWFKESALPEYSGFPWLSCDCFYGTYFFQVKLRQATGRQQIFTDHFELSEASRIRSLAPRRQASEPPSFGKYEVVRCRAVGSAKLCQGAKGGEGLDIWNVDSNSCWAQLEHVSTIGEATRNTVFFRYIFVAIKHTAQCLHPMLHVSHT